MVMNNVKLMNAKFNSILELTKKQINSKSNVAQLWVR
jgi:hypothetical protein